MHPNAPDPPLLMNLKPVDKEEAEPMETDPRELLAIVASKLGTSPPPQEPPRKASAPMVAMVEESSGPKPIHSVAIAGTSWSLVFTNDQKTFFFDATQRKSVWNTPPELANNQQVLKSLENPPWRKSK